jgi:hypothetical protein
MGLGPKDQGSSDPLFDKPYLDADEWRDDPVRHRYVHGGFERTDARFAMYFPTPERYQGRFFQPLMPVSGTEFGGATGVLTNVAGLGGYIGFCSDSGAYLVESNLGSLTPFPGDDTSIVMHRTSAAVARYSRVLAAEMYGDHRPYGYVFGGSGGAFKTITCVENHYDIWDGALPYVPGTPKAMPTMLIAPSHLFRVLGDKISTVADALEPGGSGDPFAVLSATERAALAELTLLGYDPRIWFDADRIAAQYQGGVWSMLVGNLMRADPSYFEDFWTIPGYLGADQGDSLTEDRVKTEVTVSKLIGRTEAQGLGLRLPLSMRVEEWAEAPVAVRVEELPTGDLRGATLTFVNGVAAGRELNVVDRSGEVLGIGYSAGNATGLKDVAEGDAANLDNSVYLAAQTYHRHVVHPDFPQWDQFRINDRAIYPQRPSHHSEAMPARMAGKFACKMIVVSCLMDEAAVPISADYYRRLVSDELGDRIDDQFRLWYLDNAMHTTPIVGADDVRPVRTTRVVSYLGVIHQGLRDLVSWVESGVAPPESTFYRASDGQVTVPASAGARKGIQPVPHLTVNGSDVAHVEVGESVMFVGTAVVPRGAGPIVDVEWDFDGAGDYPEKRTHVDGGEGHLSKVVHTLEHEFSEPGTYFASMRVTSQRDGSPSSLYGRIQNIARVRVIVGPRK